MNEIYQYKEDDTVGLVVLHEALRNLILLLSPFAPHICEELWQVLGNSTHSNYNAAPQRNIILYRKQNL
ncbi:MAG: class I tRNA ligase family protein [bacterium]